MRGSTLKTQTQDQSGIKSKKRILVIDDNLTNKAIIDDILQNNGYDVRYASNGPEGLEITRQWLPSLILLDLVMPDMDGMEVCKALRKIELACRPSVIIISSKGDKKTITEALNCCADDFLVKPLDESELLARVKAQLRISDFYRELEEDKRNLETILDITTALGATLDPAEVLDTIVAKVADTTAAVRCSILLISKSDEGYVLASHDNPGVHELKIDLSKYPEIQSVVESKTPLALDDITKAPLMAPVMDKIQELQDMSVLIVPIVFHDEVLGTLFLRTRKKEGGFTKKEIDFCRIVANSSFHALKNARLYEQVRREREFLQELAVKDQLTSLYNHNFFYSRLDEEFERAVRYETTLSLIMMDIDNFKNINDTYGHRVGDMVLKEIAAMIKRGVRKTDVVARYGGEEFAVILPHTQLKGALEEAERIREMVESHAYAGLTADKITLSLGVAVYPNGSKLVNSGDFVNLADDALYEAKRTGKNCVKAAPSE